MGLSTGRFPTTGGVRVAFGSVGVWYAGAVGAQSDVVSLTIYNSTNSEVTITFDGGPTDGLFLPAGGAFSYDAGANGVHLSWTAIQQKYTTAAPVSGALSFFWIRRT